MDAICEQSLKHFFFIVYHRFFAPRHQALTACEQFGSLIAARLRIAASDMAATSLLWSRDLRA
jgi:hypothetical protein